MHSDAVINICYTYILISENKRKQAIPMNVALIGYLQNKNAQLKVRELQVLLHFIVHENKKINK